MQSTPLNYDGETVTLSNSDIEEAPRFLSNLGTVDGVGGEPVAAPTSNTESAPRFLDNLGTVDGVGTKK